MEGQLKHFLLFLFTFLILSFSSSFAFVMRLIHSDSIFSPSYNPNSTIADRAINMVRSSEARLGYLVATANVMPQDNDNVGSSVFAYSNQQMNIFLVKLSIGEPMVEQFVIMDTASHLFWVKAIGCLDCEETIGQIYNPADSSTYKGLSCDSFWCDSTIYGRCSSNRDCNYYVKYMSQSSTGNLATETLTLHSYNNGNFRIPDIIFGEGMTAGKILHSGIMGLNQLNLSLVSQLGYRFGGRRFSYCFGNITDPSYIHNQISFGKGAVLQGDSIPLVAGERHYFVNWEGMSVGDKRLNIDPTTLIRTRENNGGMLIDSGASLSYLVPVAYEPFETEIRNLLEKTLSPVGFREPHRCYWGLMAQDLKGFPTVTFHFGGGVDLVQDVENMFFQAANGYFCLAVKTGQLNLIGALGQQYYNFGYDLDAQKVYFQRMDCAVLDSE